MRMPGWWAERRYGLYLDMSLASVPAWSPIGAPAERYRSHLGEVPDRLGRPSEPLVEVLVHHRDRWGHIAAYDDFAPLLTFDGFDAEEWAELVVRAGAGYTALTVKHHDGWCWWDAPGTSRTMLSTGPHRNVLAEYAAACERNDLVLGAFYSLEGRNPAVGDGDVASDVSAEIIGSQLCDLVDRYGVEMLFSDTEGRIPHLPATGDRDAVEQRAHLHGIIDRLGAGVVVDRAIGEFIEASNDVLADARGDSPGNDRITTYAVDPPSDIDDDPWQLCRPIGLSLCHNRTETEAHQATGLDIISILTEVVAKGGNLLLGVGPTADGTISDLDRAPLIEAADWIRAHDTFLREATPWTRWGDAGTRHWTTGGRLHVADIAGDGHFAVLTDADYSVEAVERVSPGSAHSDDANQVGFAQDRDGLHLLLPRSAGRTGARTEPVVYRVDAAPRARAVELFDPVTPARPALAPLLADVGPGTIVQLGDAVYTGPATVPAGVTLRGLGPERTAIDTVVGPLTVEADSRLEHLAVGVLGPDDDRRGIDAERARQVAVRVTGAGTTLLGARIDGLVEITADDTTVRATALSELRTEDAHRLLVSHCQFRGSRWSTAIEIVGGGDQEIDSCEFSGHRRAIRATETTGVAIAGNHIEAHHCGIHLERTHHAHVHRNLMVSTMRAVDVDGGSHAVIDGNAVFNGDSGCVVRGGAAECEISGNHWERCRIGLLSWNAGPVHEQDNHAVDLHEPDHIVVTGP